MRAPSTRRLAAGLVALMAVTFAPEIPAYAAEPEKAEQYVQKTPSVPGSPAQPKPVPSPKLKQFTPPKVAWPAAAVTEVELAPATGTTARAAKAAETRAGSMPVYVTAAKPAAGAAAKAAAAGPGRVRVELLARDKALETGHELAVRLSAPSGTSAVNVRIDYSTFAAAYGANWAERLRLVQVPACALTASPAATCSAEPLPTVNRDSSVSAPVTVAAGRGTIVALASGASGSSGDYGATSLSPSAAWSVGGATGGFSWSYDIKTPPSLAGPAPEVRLGYSSQAVDGRMVTTNNQASWAGEGFDYSPGFIERRYVSCSEDMSGEHNNTTKVYDQCWKTDNATMALNGSATELIYNSSEKRWHGRNENGARIERKVGAVNGDEGEAAAEGKDGDKGEYWVVTTPDGTKYYFGLNRLQGWTTGKAETASVQTSPVHGNNPDEPCRKATFAASACDQAYRWNLDYVVDPHGNTMSMWYGKDTNKYSRNKSETDLVPYDRDGYLKRIEYGTHQRDKVGGVATDTVYTATKAPMQVVFGTADRCFTACTDRANWQDTPYDQECVTGKKCENWSPTFWSTRRLSTVTTKVWNPDATDYRDVERWTLTHRFPDNGDGTPGSLWLSELAHEGLLGTRATVPNIVFNPTALDNRVDTALQNGLRPMRRPRMDTIVTETGAKIDVNYKPVDCAAGALPTPETNTKRCYPVRWAPEDLGQAPGTEITDWFHKYVVDNVIENDATSRPTGSPLATVTRYAYEGGAAWRYADDDGLTKANRRTWNQFRGYELVRTTVGEPGEQNMSESRYFRGMHGDRKEKAGGTKVARVTDSKGVATIDDLDEYAGMLRESITYDGPGKPISGELEWPWRGEPTATRTLGTQTTHARFVSTGETRGWAALDGGRPDRWTRTVQEFDDFGMAVRSTDYGDTGVPGDEKCTLTDYARNSTAAWLMNYPSRVRELALTCAEATQSGRVLTEADVIGDVRTHFDDKAWGAAPTRGETTRIEELKAWRNNAPEYLTTKTAVYDDYGRVTDLYDVANRRTRTAYTPAVGGPLSKVVVTNPAGWTDITESDPMGNATRIEDANSRVTTKRYDGLGRLTDVWLPGRSTSATPNFAHAYGISNTAATWVETKTLNPAGAQVPMVEFYDALLRVRQRQYGSGTGVGRIVSDSFYDSAGRQYLTWGPYHEQSKGVERALWVPADAHEKIDIWNRKFYDGAGRVKADVQYSRLTETWRTTTTYTGDRTTVVPPLGGTASATVTDAAGRTTELWQYKSRDLVGGYDRTVHTYDRKGKQSKVRNQAGTEWRFGWDLRGRQTSAVDPDKGTSRTTFDDESRVVTVTDGRERTLTYSYADPLGRKTALHEGTEVTPARQLAAWGYDEVLDTAGKNISLGMQTSSTRYVGGATGAAYRKATTGLDSAGRVTKSTVTVPSAATGLAGTYEYQSSFKVDGSPATTRLPAIGGTGGLGVETLSYGYQSTGLATTLASTLGSSYVVSTGYTEYGETGLMTLRNASGRTAQIGQYYETKTRRLNRIWTTREQNPASVSDLYFGYDDMGNVISAKESSSTAGAENQCFSYDYLARLTEAWTPADPDCKAAPTTAALTGPAPYWTSWRFDTAGNRTEQIEHRTPAGERTTTYAYPAQTAARPHAMTGTTTTDTAGTRTAAYGYDNSGNTITRPAATGTQTLGWNAEGRMESSTDSTGITTYLYDADGGRLLRKDPNGTTLYLPGQELRVDPQGQRIGCTRYYQHAGKAVAMRTTAGVTWLAGDHQGTSSIAIDAVSQAFSVRRQDPFGNARGAVTGASWPAAMDKGLVGGTKDNSGLTHLGARMYDPVIGRFVSVDPIVDFNDPQQIQGYSYANNTPVTKSDPSGLMPMMDDRTPCTPDLCGNNYNRGGQTGKKQKRDNPYRSDYEERQATGNPAEAERIRAVRKRQIMEGKFGIRDRLKEQMDKAFDQAEKNAAAASGGRRCALCRIAKPLIEDFTEDMMVEAWIDAALARIDESRHDDKHKQKDNVAFDDDEFVIAFELAHTGRIVESRDESLRTVGNPDSKVFDAYVDDVRSEFKSTTSNSANRIGDIYSGANKQHATRLYLYTGDDTEAESVKKGQANFARMSKNRDVQELREVQVMGEVTAPLQSLSEDLDCEGWDWWNGC
ncbi:RHS repeat-associated core domain-containing protein [Actinoplanes auranticolor]|uniref:Type IV secretion protein Rhs n=1 Tax=Actinoplanes auranticolor TaxID=47988 RepID=A0A919VMX0_9ACTN|nr:RHS repeat-associated core domain-containing protein [Actinoplanes auranticolor]GIM69506.1 type IV secretion protein Rhs [Actinoplanes auranticolor]